MVGCKLEVYLYGRGQVKARHNMTVSFRPNEALPGEERKARSRNRKVPLWRGPLCPVT